MRANTDETALKLHTARDGRLWYADGARAPRSLEISLPDLFTHSLLASRADRFVRVLGVAENATLLVALFEQLQQGLLSRIEVAGPRICETNRERADPETVLFRMRQCLQSASLGGWHVMTRLDHTMYALVAAVHRAGGVADNTALLYLYQHPAWPYLRFVQGLSHQAAACVLARIIDPRWYVSPRHVDRLSYLERYLGLSPLIQERVSDPRQMLTTPEELSCFHTMECWKSRDPPSEPERTIPEHFLWRLWFTLGGGPRADLRTSQKFLLYLRYTWLGALCQAQADPLFDPNLFFKHPDELEAYRAYASRLRAPPADGLTAVGQD